jgi:cytochrome c oxidase cbb3-type subunit IV
MDIDINTWRSLITVLSLLLFLGLMAWTLNRHRRQAFDEAALLPFADEPVGSMEDKAPAARDRSKS